MKPSCLAVIAAISGADCARSGLTDGRLPSSRPPLTRIELGFVQFCATDEVGSSHCAGHIDAERSLNPLAPFAAGYARTDQWLLGNRTCRLSSSGAVSCVGGGALSSDLGPDVPEYLEGLTPIAVSGPVKKIATNSAWTCFLLRSRGVECLGRARLGEVLGPPRRHTLVVNDAIDIATRYDLTCVLRANNSVECFGVAHFGAAPLGEVLADGSIRLAAVPSLDRVRSIGNNTGSVIFGINSNGVAWWWGQLGSNEIVASTPFTTALFPTELPIPNVAEVAFGRGFGCVRNQAGVISCFGANTNGELGISQPGLRSSLEPITLPGPSTAMSANYNTACAIVNDRVYCWGRRPFTLMSDRGVRWSPVPRPALVEIAARTLRFDYERAYAVDSQQRAWGWKLTADILGSDPQMPLSRDRLGTGTIIPPREPTLIPSLGSVRSLGYSCALGTDGSIFTWGNINQTPTQFVFAERVTELVCSARDLIMRSADGRVFRVQRRDRQPQNPFEVVAWRNAQSLSAGEHHACVVTENGRVECVGSGSVGELGERGLMPTAEPVEVALPRRARSVVARNFKTCAITDDSALYCWGLNQSNELGGIPSASIARPVLMSQFANVRQVHPGGNVICILNTENRVQCIGNNVFGQLGVPAVGTSSEIAVTLPLENVVGLTGYNDLVCATFDAAPPQCWGLHPFNELGDGVATSYAIPAEIPFDSVE